MSFILVELYNKMNFFTQSPPICTAHLSTSKSLFPDQPIKQLLDLKHNYRASWNYVLFVQGKNVIHLEGTKLNMIYLKQSSYRSTNKPLFANIDPMIWNCRHYRGEIRIIGMNRLFPQPGRSLIGLLSCQQCQSAKQHKWIKDQAIIEHTEPPSGIAIAQL